MRDIRGAKIPIGASYLPRMGIHRDEVLVSVLSSSHYHNVKTNCKNGSLAGARQRTSMINEEVSVAEIGSRRLRLGMLDSERCGKKIASKAQPDSPLIRNATHIAGRR